MLLKKLATLHQQVVHNNTPAITESRLELEDVWIKRYPYDLLKNVCSDCFSDPDLSEGV